MTKREILADAILVLTAFIWGTGFVVMKNTVDTVPPGAIIAIRYAIASGLTAILFRKHLKGLTRGDVLRGALVGLLYMAVGVGLYALLSGQAAPVTAYLADLAMGVAAGGIVGMILSNLTPAR